MAHLEDPRVLDPAPVLVRAASAGVTDIINASFSPERVLPAEVGNSAIRVHRCTGLHPLAIDPARLGDQLAAVTEACPEHLAVGEIGLDSRSHAPPMDAQRDAFERQLAIARIQEKAVIVHCVQAWGPLLECLERFWPLRGIVHGFSGSAELLPRIRQIGLLPSFGGGITHERHKKARAAAARAERFCIESDTPDHPPAGCESSEPAELPRVIRALADIRGESPDDVREGSIRAAQEAFGIPEIAE